MACLWKTHQTTSILNISDIERSQQSSVLPDHAKSLSSHQEKSKTRKAITKRNYLMIYLFLFAFVLHQVCLRGSRRKPDRVIYSPCCVISYCILFCKWWKACREKLIRTTNNKCREIFSEGGIDNCRQLLAPNEWNNNISSDAQKGVKRPPRGP